MEQTHVLKLACEPIPTVRIGFVGLGKRGMVTLQRYLMIEGIDIVALCDVNSSHLTEAQAMLTADKRYSPTLYDAANGWRTMCERTDVDLVYICTDWLTHTPMACYAMEHGKHVAVEVPAANALISPISILLPKKKTRRAV